jgi:hypothetical protein
MCAYLKAIIHLVSLKTGHIPTSHQRSHEQHPMGVLRTPKHVVSSGSCVIKRTCAVSEDYICRVSQIQSREGSSVRAAHVFDRGKYQVTARHSVARISGLVIMFIVLLLSFRLFEARSPVWVACTSRSTLRSSCAVRARRLASGRSTPRENLWGVQGCGARRQDSELRWVAICYPIFVPSYRRNGAASSRLRLSCTSSSRNPSGGFFPLRGGAS